MTLARFLVPVAAGLLALSAGAGAAVAGDAYGRAHVPVLTRYVPVSHTVTSVATLLPAARPAVTVTHTVPGPTVVRHAVRDVTVPGPTVTVTHTVTVPGPTLTVTAPAVTVTHTVTVSGPTVTVSGPTVTVTVPRPAVTASAAPAPTSVPSS